MGPNSLDRMTTEHRANETFLELLAMFNTQGQDVSHKIGPTFAPNRFAEWHRQEAFSDSHATLDRLAHPSLTGLSQGTGRR
jgi:hypothetical protein